jgi:Y_Y_Y domain/Two component regulator propeller
MKSRVLFVLVLSLVCISAFSQSGNYFLSHYTPIDERIDYLTFDIAQDDHGVVYFGNKGGILQFDGRNWSLIPATGPIYTLSIHGREVFAGGFSGYGKLIYDSDNVQSYVSLSKDQNASQIIASLYYKEEVFFLNDQNLYVVSAATGKTETVMKAGPQGFTGLFEIGDNIYVGIENGGLRKIEARKLVPANLGLPSASDLIFSSILRGTKKTMLANEIGQVFIQDGATITEVPIADKLSLLNSVVVGGAWVNEDLMAIGTLRGGVFFIEPKTGITKEVINYYTGLPDNEVFAILNDRNDGVWIAHDYGITRAAPSLPFRSYSHYPGLEGNLLCAYSFRGELYVGTTLGLYELVKEDVYADETYFVNRPLKEIKEEREELPKAKKGLFSFLKRNKKEASPKVEVQAAPVTTKSSPKTATRKVLKSSRFIFKHVEGIQGKVSQLVEADGMLMAAGISGVLALNGTGNKVVTSEPVRSIFMSSALHQLLVSTFDDNMKSFAMDAKSAWHETHLLDTLNEYVGYMFEDKLQNIWLCGRNGVMKVETDNNAVTEINKIPFSHPSIDEAVGVAYGNDVYIVASGVFNHYDETQNRLVTFDSLPGTKKYFASAGNLWFYDGHNWQTADRRLKKELKLSWLGLFPNIRYLAPTGHGEGLWVITGSNELYNFAASRALSQPESYPLFLREVRGQQSKIAASRTVKVSQLEGTVSFEFIQPDFLGMKAIEYQYRVSGLTKKWSEWSRDNYLVNFSYLPTGKYKVEVQTRDLMGRISKVPTQIDLVVEPPYWRQSWFYAAEFAFFSMLVFISLKLSTANSRYRYISRLLSLLTVILLIQFIQTVVASFVSFKSTPVLDFFVQVLIALLVLPIEGYLRKFMIRSTESHVEIKKILDEAKK